jgi:hypothetical protein
MRVPLTICAVMAAAASAMATADPPSSPAVPTPETDERLVVSADGSSLSQDHGGGGGAVTWLSNVGAGDVVGIGAEYQTIANSHWTTGVFTGATTFGQGSSKLSLYAEAHEGAGDIGQEAFHYSVLAGGVIGTFTPQFSVQLEERRLDIDTSHGNLPKVGISLGLMPALVASVAYAQSFGGNLGTKLGTARLDYTGKSINWLGGVAYGPVAPSVLNLIGQVLAPAPTLREGFIGLGKTFGRTEWKLLGDYQDIEGFKRTTITLACTLHLEAPRQPP